MTITELIEKRHAQLQKILVENVPLNIAVRSTVAKQAQRIFIEGKNSSGGSIGQYDTKNPLYVNPDKAPRAGAVKAKGIEGLKPTKGKHGDHKFKNGKDHKTTYVNNYKDFRNRMGRRVDIVNLSLSNDLQSDFSTAKVSGSSPHNPERISAHQYHVTLKRPVNAAKREGLEKKYGTIFKLSQGEKKLFHEVIQKELAAILND